jgi:hypothetical protein
LVGKLEGKRQLRIRRRRCQDNFNVYLREILWDGLYWIHLAEDKNQNWELLNTAMKLRVSIKGGEFLD